MRKFFQQQIPGHVRAYTWSLASIAVIIAVGKGGGVSALIGAVLIPVGEFLGNQATHLFQENHKGMAMSWLESQQELHTLFFQITGLLIFGLGIWLLI